MHRREFVLQLMHGEQVLADERYFFVDVASVNLSRKGWTAEEAEVMVDHRWWSVDELAVTSETVWPEDLVQMLRRRVARA